MDEYQLVVKALNRIAAGIDAHAKAINRLADVYLYCNDPEGEAQEVQEPEAPSLPGGFRGMR